jgi:hypothetical protein
MGGAITAVAAITMVGTGATIMVGGIIIAIGGDVHRRSRSPDVVCWPDADCL